MSSTLAIQYVVIAVAVVVSAWVVLRKQFPAATRRMLVAVAVPMVRAGRPAWLQRFGRWLAPARTTNAGACGGCDNCGPKTQ